MQTDFVKPCYDTGNFACLPQRIKDLLSGPEKYDAIVLFLMDGFGWRFFEKYQETPFLKNITRIGRVEKLVTQFPSTTAAQLTTLHTGMPVGEHGIFEWFFYEPTLDALIAPLLFSFAGTSQRDTLKQAGVKPRRFFPSITFYQVLKKQGVKSIIFQHREYTPSSFGEVVFSGAKPIGYKTLPEALVNLVEALEQLTPAHSEIGIASPAYFVLYNEKIDAVSHEYGPDSPQTDAEIQVFLMTMEAILMKALIGNRRKIMFLLTGDHGQSEVDPRTTIYLNHSSRFAGIEKFLKVDRQGNPIVPAGSARDFFLYIRPDMINEARDFLATRLESHAEVRKVTDLMSEGYFGPRLSSKFCARVGDLVILPYRYESVWWYEKNKYQQNYYGHHGGLTPQEMEIPLLMWEM
jgi:predicted AlkP superfamily pyrophosphatase or phosphodiesterase